MDSKTREMASRQAARGIDYRAVFETEPGKRVLEDLCQIHHMKSSSFSKDALEMAMFEGERNVILRIIAILEMDMDKLNKLIRQGEENEPIQE